MLPITEEERKGFWFSLIKRPIKWKIRMKHFCEKITYFPLEKVENGGLQKSDNQELGLPRAKFPRRFGKKRRVFIVNCISLITIVH